MAAGQPGNVAPLAVPEIPQRPTPQRPNAATVGPAAEAARTGRRVELDHLRTENTQVFVEPSGLHTMVQHAVPVRARKGTGWAPIDTTLRFQPDGSVRPGATVTELTLSGGGDTNLVALGKKTAQVRMGWPARLPRPVLTGDTATYPEVYPGVDLRIRAEADGFAQVLVVKTRAAARNPALRRVSFPLSSTGLTVSTRVDGTTVAADPTGKTVFSAAKAVMWDTPPATADPAEKAAAGRSGSRCVPAGHDPDDATGARSGDRTGPGDAVVRGDPVPGLHRPVLVSRPPTVDARQRDGTQPVVLELRPK